MEEESKKGKYKLELKDKLVSNELLYLIYSVVEEIPEGYVATYGQIAELIGKPKNSRLIGRALKISYMYGKFPCHRVVNYKGRITSGWNEQVILLKNEGVKFKDEFHVDLKKHKWTI